MESPEEYWRQKYFKLLRKYRKLQEHVSQLSDSYMKVKIKNKNHKRTISELSDQLLTSPSLGPESESPTRRSPNHSITRRHGRNSQKMYEGFFIVGATPSSALSVLEQYPAVLDFSFANLTDFAFPTGWKASYLDLSRSGTAIYQLLYPSFERNESSFIFTIKAGQADNNLGHPSLLNNDKEVLFGCCVIENDFAPTTDPFRIPITPKCYCLISYVPCFELHFQVLYAFLSIKKDHRLSSLEGAVDETLIGKEQFGLLETYYENYFLNSRKVSINLQSVSGINITLPESLSLLDIEYTCCLMFSVLSLNELFAVLCAAMTEKSVVFVSSNLAVVSNCVLGIQSLMKPFKWAHLLSPMLPLSLYDALEAPVPFILGIPKWPQKDVHSHSVLWVFLDEEQPEKRIYGGNVVEPHANGLKDKLKPMYKVFEQKLCYSPSKEQLKMCSQIAMKISTFWHTIIDCIPKPVSNIDDARVKVVESSARKDKNFIRQVVNTQFFTSFIESKM